MIPKKHLLGPTFYAVSAVILFSTGGLAIKWLPLAALPIAGWRALVAAGFIGFYLARRTGKSFFPRISRVGIAAAAGYLLMTVSYVSSMKLTTAANAIFLQYTMPAWVMIGGAIWLRESITMGRILAIAISFTGMFLFFLDELSPQQWLGNILALLSGLGYAIVALTLRKDRDQNPAGAVFWGNAMTALFMIPIGMVLYPESWALLMEWPSLIALLWLGIFQIGVAYLFFVYALKFLPAIEVAILSLIEPVLNPTWVFLLLDEKPGKWALLGGVIILFSVAMRTFLREESEIGKNKG